MTIRTDKLPREPTLGTEAVTCRAATDAGAAVDERELGRGRSGIVYLRQVAGSAPLACKVFDSGGLTKLVQCVLLGSPNPYMWNEDAVRCALLRRRILLGLVEHWFGSAVRVAGAVGYGFDEERKTFELQTEYTTGVPLLLRQPAAVDGHGRQLDRLTELTGEVMRPLQRYLIDSGFDGLVWQAGKGNPVALNNFLLERRDGGECYVWIDLESGVPALFPANPWSLLSFYLPRAVRYGHPMFDDVDVGRLQQYLAANSAELTESLGVDRTLQLRTDAIALRAYQGAWKSLPLHWRSIGYQQMAGRLSAEQAAFYRCHRLRFGLRELRRYTRSAARRIAGLPGRILTAFRAVRWGRIPGFWFRSLFSQRFRNRMTRRYVTNRIRSWRRRGQLTSSEARHLRQRLHEEESSAYLGDFGVHLALKPLVKIVEWWVLPMMWGFGWIGDGTLAIGMVALGCLVRTLYTAFRLVQAVISGRDRPWAALGIGAFPIIGNLAYPLQIVYSSTGADDDLARFILHDASARLGRHLPIWGGADTLTEHWFHRLPDLLIGRTVNDGGGDTTTAASGKAAEPISPAGEVVERVPN